jgi:hypothetical protein
LNLFLSVRVEFVHLNEASPKKRAARTVALREPLSNNVERRLAA